MVGRERVDGKQLVVMEIQLEVSPGSQGTLALTRILGLKWIKDCDSLVGNSLGLPISGLGGGGIDIYGRTKFVFSFGGTSATVES